MATNVPNDEQNENSTYCGACMEVAGIESCGIGYGAKEIPVEQSENK